MTFAIWHGRRLNISFDASLLRTVFFDVLHTMSGPLTAEYDGYSFTTDIDLVYVQSNDFVGVSAGGVRVEAVIGLDWIGSFRAVIPNLYTEPSVNEDVETVSDLIGMDSLRTQECDPLFFIFGNHHQNLFTMPDYLLCEFGTAHGVSWREGATFMWHVLIKHVFSSCLLGRQGHSCCKLWRDQQLSDADIHSAVLMRCISSTEIEFPTSRLRSLCDVLGFELGSVDGRFELLRELCIILQVDVGKSLAHMERL